MLFWIVWVVHAGARMCSVWLWMGAGFSGTMGGKNVEGDLLGKLLSKRGHLLCSLLRSRSLQYKAELVKAFSEKVLPHFEAPSASTTLRPVIDGFFNMQDIAEAHRHMEANKNMGKIVIKVIESVSQQL
ncbi:hypothetical protein ACEWY4_005334 [Coilia grayii]|uniref:Uncharacterized protein n=1 Tax=Coilia grayii TaxID=363190 RepID=A0ABD1KIC4_9TELE